ncbi:unnamed protein product [Linum trigynum]|uniref:non-specific serine/threonine protein kinase n=1 Tax=Linum trigynum TaxID=586398 RepID=A0AAV2EHG7_9ROSI
MSNTTADAPAPSTPSPSPPPPAAASPPPPKHSPPPPPPKHSPPPPPSTKPPPKSPPPGYDVRKSPPLPPPPVQPFVSPPAPVAGDVAPPPRRSRPLGPPSHREKEGGSQDNNNGNNGVAIGVGVVVGVAAILFIAMLSYFCCCRKRKRKEELTYYSTAPPPHKGGGYYMASPNPGMMAGYYATSPPPQTWQVNKTDGGAAAASRWQTQTPPPPQYNPPPTTSAGRPPPLPAAAASSSDDFSSSFSGNHGAPAPPPPHPGLALGAGFHHNNSNAFSYEELQIATNGFDQSNLLGQGGFGYVHKGVLTNGKDVAVKSLKAGSGQGDREFQAEVEIITRVHHRHLVTLVGYSIARDQKLLVYEFVPNSTLEFHLHGKNRPTMDWPTRLKIAIGAAKGLAYLHEDCHPRIIHRDIKAANILLDYNFEAKVADFGLAKLSQDNYTHVSTRVMGTFGYLAPEYASSGKLTDKSDVFSFGVVLLELITGRPPLDLQNQMDDSLVDWARPRCSKALEDGNCQGLVDPRLEGNYDPKEMSHMVACAANAIRHSSKKRPKMSQIVRTLEGDASLDHLNDGGVKPGQSSYFGQASSDNNSEYDHVSYSADMKKFRKAVLEYQSSEYGMTSEYGLNPSASSSEEMSRKH